MVVGAGLGGSEGVYGVNFSHLLRQNEHHPSFGTPSAEEATLNG
jgi:hypothetical protein